MSQDLMQLDFLPAQYHRKHATRQSRPWRWVAVVAFALLLGMAGFAQYRQGRALRSELELLQPQYDLAVTQQEKLTALQSQLKEADTVARLLTYIRHPWPRTQLLSAIARDMPSEVELTELQIFRQAEAGSGRTQTNRFRSERNDDAKELEKLPPAERDLKVFREKLDGQQTVVRFTGLTNDEATLYQYLQALARQRLISKAELEGSEAVEGAEQGQVRFEATLVVKPGYGQPGGPEGPPRSVLAASKRPEAAEARP